MMATVTQNAETESDWSDHEEQKYTGTEEEAQEMSSEDSSDYGGASSTKTSYTEDGIVVKDNSNADKARVWALRLL